MKEIHRIIKAYDAFDEQGLKMALATVVRISGSSYRRTGARMLMTERGEWVGGVSGGCLEGDLLKQAKQVMLNGQAQWITYDTTEDDPYQIGVGLGCHGIIEILIAPLDSKLPNPISVLKQLLKERKTHILLTLISNKTTLKIAAGTALLYEENSKANALINLFEAELKAVITQKKSTLVQKTIEGNAMEVFIELIPPPIHVILFGSEYDIYPLLEMVAVLGWDLTLVAHPLKVGPSVLHKAVKLVSNKTNYQEKIKIDAQTALLIMAHDYNKDYACLERYATTEIAYIGLLGPKSRGEKLLEQLNTNIRLSEDQLERIHFPIGLDIGANNPEEIALAILAEVQAVFARRFGGLLKWREGEIHANPRDARLNS